jgi:heptaprenyl diphosphate synthase
METGTMERKNTDRLIENYIAETASAIYHPILEKEAEPFEIERSKAFFLLLPLLNGERWSNHIHKVSIAVGAVQSALYAHDLIDQTHATSKKQQLTVLSGDFFSGIHYRILASISEFNFIRKMSETIGHINEIKTDFHEQFPSDADLIIEGLEKIEAGCIIEFLNVFGFSKYSNLVAAALPFIWLETAQKSENGKTTKDQNIQLLDEQVKHKVISECRKRLQVEIEQADFLSPYLQSEIRSMTAPLLGHPM